MTSKWDKQINSLSDKRIALARKFQRAGITTFTQAVKAFANRDDETIEGWKKELTALNTPKPTYQSEGDYDWTQDHNDYPNDLIVYEPEKHEVSEQ